MYIGNNVGVQIEQHLPSKFLQQVGKNEPESTKFSPILHFFFFPPTDGGQQAVHPVPGGRVQALTAQGSFLVLQTEPQEGDQGNQILTV